jgi:hypothetical protein
MSQTTMKSLRQAEQMRSRPVPKQAVLRPLNEDTLKHFLPKSQLKGRRLPSRLDGIQVQEEQRAIS